MTTMHLNKLKKNLDEDRQTHLFACIKDLVVNGFQGGRLTDGDSSPSRQEITQYIASWCRYVRMDSDTCLEWMIDYCTTVLSVLSSSSVSRIRHSTKGNVKYIYNSEIKFECEREKNPFKAHCDSKCPVYQKMGDAIQAKKIADSTRSFEPAVDLKRYNELPVSNLSVKEVYKEQFEKALTVIIDCIDRGVSKKDIVSLLNERDFKTRTGKKWSPGILRNELHKLKNK